MLWEYDLAQLGEEFTKHQDKAKENGHFYSLTEDEVGSLVKVMPCPLDQSLFYNATSVVDQDEYMG